MKRRANNEDLDVSKRQRHDATHPFFAANKFQMPRIFSSKPLVDRDSTFIGHFASLQGCLGRDVPVVIEALKDLEANKDASHCMSAWKLARSNGSDDDGEKYGGTRLLGILQRSNIDGVLVVARWFGGTMLGPVRFAHIENCAKEAINIGQQEMKRGPPPRSPIMPKSPGITVEKAVRILKARDLSIASLREMLATARATTPSPSKAPTPEAYSKMPLQRLEALLLSRDNTIKFLRTELHDNSSSQQEGTLQESSSQEQTLSETLSQQTPKPSSPSTPTSPPASISKPQHT